MKKDVIYIDIEDDITAIIDKVKHAKAPIVALVPPKRIGVLQSSVNLKLLQRAADGADKRVVLITNDAALTALAAGLSLPIAKNLQSKPEISAVDETDSADDDVIHGEVVPEATTGSAGSVEDIEVAEPSDTDTSARSALSGSRVKNKKGLGAAALATGMKIPNFDIFRKKLFILGGLSVLLVGFLTWAIFFAGEAKIAITARTNIININKTLQLKSGATLDANQGVVAVITKQVKKTTAVDFQPTGTKQVGEKATGTVKFVPTSANAILNGATIPAGTQLSSGSLSFVTAAAATILPTSFPDYLSGKTASVTVAVTATVPGTTHNGITGALSGEPSGVDVSLTAATAGGTDKVATVVSADDIVKATAQLKSEDANTVKLELAKQFAADEIVISEAYIVEAGNPVTTPAVDQEATTAKLTAETTYTLLGIKRADLKSVYDTFLATQLKGDASQKVYASGDDATQFASFQKIEGGYSVRAVGNAQVGPNIDSKKVAEDARGKQSGEVRQSIEAIQGVDNVSVTLSPFWVTRVPGDVNRINVTFVIKND